MGGWLVAAGIALTSLVVLPSVPPALGLLTWGFGAFGMGILFGSLAVLLLQYSTPAEQGINSASIQVADSLGVITFTGISGAIFASAQTSGGATSAHVRHDLLDHVGRRGVRGRDAPAAASARCRRARPRLEPGPSTASPSPAEFGALRQPVGCLAWSPWRLEFGSGPLRSQLGGSPHMRRLVSCRLRGRLVRRRACSSCRVRAEQLAVGQRLQHQRERLRQHHDHDDRQADGGDLQPRLPAVRHRQQAQQRQGLRVGHGLCGGQADGLHRRPGGLGLRPLQRPLRPRQQELRLRPEPDLDLARS